jgi:predicted regulator of Ras-like GTPase activity (Roadblock/LC7/MglB family)
VPDEARIELPWSMIQPQLASGRVVLAPKIFQAAMPADFRELVAIDPAETPLQLPLQEVLKNLPGAALQMRGDQVEAEKGATFETPFSIKAKEDAERFKVSDAPIEKPVEPEAPKATEEKINLEPAEKLDAKKVVTRASELPGVAGCLVTFADGLSLAGNLPEDVAVGGLCAMAPSLLQRIEKHMLETKLGAMNAMTLHGDQSAVTFFMHDNIYLTALHSGPELGAETQSKLAEMAKQLSRTYAEPESTHVDH